MSRGHKPKYLTGWVLMENSRLLDTCWFNRRMDAISFACSGDPGKNNQYWKNLMKNRNYQVAKVEIIVYAK